MILDGKVLQDYREPYSKLFIIKNTNYDVIKNLKKSKYGAPRWPRLSKHAAGEKILTKIEKRRPTGRLYAPVAQRFKSSRLLSVRSEVRILSGAPETFERREAHGHLPAIRRRVSKIAQENSRSSSSWGVLKSNYAWHCSEEETHCSAKA